MEEEALAAKRAEITARVAAARAQQEEQAAAAVVATGGATSSVSSGGGSSGKKTLSKKEKVKALEGHTVPSADTLRRQAKEMCRNPGMVRRANPEMRNFTDAQIREHAKEMEKMAANPEMMDAMMRMQSLSESERYLLNQLQEGLAGKISRDEKWITDTIRLVKEQPDTLKMLFKGRVSADSPLSETQIMSILDYVVTCSDFVLINAVQLVNWAVRMRGPAGELYRKVDDATMGCAQYLVLIAMLLTLFYVGKILWYLVTLTFGLLISTYALLTTTGEAHGDADFGSAMTPEPSSEDEAPFVGL